MYNREVNPKLSIITTIYNAERYVQESLDSIFSQPFSDFELILVNDGSTDKTRDIILQSLNRPNVRLLENKYNEGIPVSRNRALLEARGKYVAIHDADDVTLPQRFIKQVKMLDSRKEIVAVGTHAIKINASGQVIGSMVYPPKTTEQAFRMIMQIKLNPIIDPSCMYRKDMIIDYGGYPMDPEFLTVPDFHLWCRLISNNHRIANIQERLIKYRVNPKGVTRTRNAEMVQATNKVWASFKRRNLKKLPLRADYFQSDSFMG
jgi:glycosyltransferase involved in cell wall biosynthesis